VVGSLHRRHFKNLPNRSAAVERKVVGGGFLPFNSNIILLFVGLVKRCPVLPVVFVNCPHS